MFSTMFQKLSLLALAAAPLISALTLHTPSEPTSQGEITISWDTAPGDPEAFTLELIHPSFNNALAISNNIDPAQGSITVTLPVVPPQGGYTLEAVNIGNIDDVYSETGPFAIAPSTASVSTVASTSRSSGASSASSATGSSASSATRPATSGSSPANGSSVGSGASSVSTAPPSVTNLTDNNSSAASVSANIGLLAAVAGAILIL